MFKILAAKLLLNTSNTNLRVVFNCSQTNGVQVEFSTGDETYVAHDIIKDNPGYSKKLSVIGMGLFNDIYSGFTAFKGEILGAIREKVPTLTDEEIQLISDEYENFCNVMDGSRASEYSESETIGGRVVIDFNNGELNYLDKDLLTSRVYKPDYCASYYEEKYIPILDKIVEDTKESDKLFNWAVIAEKLVAMYHEEEYDIDYAKRYILSKYIEETKLDKELEHI